MRNNILALPNPLAVDGDSSQARLSPYSPGASDLGDIIVRGARQHNLKGIDIRFPRHRFIVVTGVSGSGKSSLAIDTLYAEGQRRYVESLSAYARQFVGQMEKPKVDQIIGLSPTIAIGQKTVSHNPRSTVGTVTEVMDYLRVLYARLGTPHCPQCGKTVLPQSPLQIAGQILALKPGTRFQILAPLVRGRKGSARKLLAQARRDGYRRVRIDGQMELLQSKLPRLEKTKRHNIELVVDRLQLPSQVDADFRQRLIDSAETALRTGSGLLIVDLGDEEILFSENNACPHCDISFPELNPNMFSFNSPAGMCPDCNGLGHQLQVDPDLIITKPQLSLLDGASPYFGELRKKADSWISSMVHAVAGHYQADLERPWQELPDRFRHVILYGSAGEELLFKYENQRRSFSGEMRSEFEGAVRQIDRFFRQTHSDYRRRFLSNFMNRQPCPTCQGERLCSEARFVTAGGKRLPQILQMNIREAHQWAGSLHFTAEQAQVAEELIKEVRDRLQFMLNVGLHYLTLNRNAPTLSGGESQRIRLASQLGCGLVGVIYVRFPLGVFSTVTGVSGSGKSSLVRHTLYPALARTLHNAQTVPGPHHAIEGLNLVHIVINITQDPIGRTPRSNPATYVGVFTAIRSLFASLPEAKTRGYKAGRFSFNAQGGRCDTCRGHGRKRVEMHFLPDVWVTCAACNGSRYNHQTLEVTYHGRSIADILDMEVQEALEFFAPHPKIARILQTLYDVGLEYLKLGQSALTLSGGEAQRVKLAKELSRVAVGNTVYILDEPTTGLHFADIQRLLDVLHRLVDSGNTVIVVEHNLDVISAADYIVDLGPEGGDAGGYIVAQGTPEQVAQDSDSYTGQFLAGLLETSG